MRFKIAIERKNGKLIRISINFRDNIDEVNSQGKFVLFQLNCLKKTTPQTKCKGDLTGVDFFYRVTPFTLGWVYPRDPLSHLLSK
jgi:hypothetical protein